MSRRRPTSYEETQRRFNWANDCRPTGLLLKCFLSAEFACPSRHGNGPTENARKMQDNQKCRGRKCGTRIWGIKMHRIKMHDSKCRTMYAFFFLSFPASSTHVRRIQKWEEGTRVCITWCISSKVFKHYLDLRTIVRTKTFVFRQIWEKFPNTARETGLAQGPHP